VSDERIRIVLERLADRLEARAKSEDEKFNDHLRRFSIVGRPTREVTPYAIALRMVVDEIRELVKEIRL